MTHGLSSSKQATENANKKHRVILLNQTGLADMVDVKGEHVFVKGANESSVELGFTMKEVYEVLKPALKGAGLVYNVLVQLEACE